MKIVYFGTSDFGVPILEALALSRHKIPGVVTALDKRKGRGQRLSASCVKIMAEKKGLNLLQPENLHIPSFIQALKERHADLFVVCAYGKILTKEILQIPQKYAINLHASLLPKYRGAAPINWAIIKGESQTGVTVFKMNEYMDKGEMILQQKTDISFADTSVSLAEKLRQIGKEVVLNSLDLIEQGRATFTTQDETRASVAPKLKKEDGLIDWKSKALEIHNRIRGLQPWPGAFTYLDNNLLKIWQSKLIAGKQEAEAGEVLDADAHSGILVQTGEGRLLITIVQLAGKKEMPAGKFISGYRLKKGKKLGR